MSLDEIKIINHSPSYTIAQLTENLFREQLQEWPNAKEKYDALKNVCIRDFNTDGHYTRVQFNPERIYSSTAKIDEKSIKERNCFLCKKNLPAEQRGIQFNKDFLILINPFPIFEKHLTIINENHIDQLILPNIGTMLDLAAALPDYVVFYNGPKCGASAPDHMHFQAGNKGFMPIESEFKNSKKSLAQHIYKNTNIFFTRDHLRRMVSLQGSNKESLIEAFTAVYNLLAANQPNEKEPMLNILCYKENNDWILHIFPRIKHRPSQFFANDNSQIVISPASVDCGGVLITPRAEDFDKIKDTDIIDIFEQVIISKNELDILQTKIKNTLK